MSSPSAAQSSHLRDSKGWDGKLRVEKPSTSDSHDERASSPDSDSEQAIGNGNSPHTAHATLDKDSPRETTFGGQIEADEDLLDDVPVEETDIDVNHCRINSIPALRLERFPKLTRLCLRQNAVSKIAFPDSWAAASSLKELDLYDNLISHVKGLDQLVELTSLDLSFNKIKHIKNVNHLKKLKDVYFVQNKISKIEGLEGLDALENLELGANRIREIENLDTLTNLKQLWLGKNKITELKNLSPLQNLTTLSIQSNRLTSASLTHLSSLTNLTDLYVSYNAIDSLFTLPPNLPLTNLDISSNPINSLAGLGPMKTLEELWASNCKLESFEEMEKELADKTELSTVYFEGNPLQTRQPALYRNKVRLALPRVRQVDAIIVRTD